MCLEFILCKKKSVCVIEYNIVDDKCELTLKQSFEFGDEYNVYYSGDDCGMCVFDSMSERKSENEFKSKDNMSNDINSDGHVQSYDIILFGHYYKKFVSSLFWLSLKISNNKSYTISIDNDKTKKFQNTFVDNEIGYNRFGYTKWKHYLILFGGDIHGVGSTDSIFYFDFFQMKWYQSIKVL